MAEDVAGLEVEYQKSLARAAELKVPLDRAWGIGSGKDMTRRQNSCSVRPRIKNLIELKSV